MNFKSVFLRKKIYFNHINIAYAYFSTKLNHPKICIVGSGPAGFYTAQQILKSNKEAQIDIIERLPVPFGLVRYGVAPDHPEVKNCINAFTEAARNERVNFFGNVSVGTDISLDQLKKSYHAIILAYGAAKDRALNVPGEEFANVLSAREVVGWYNGAPECSGLNVDLDVEDVLVIGQGNVAVDVSRILLSPVDILKKTDIPEPVLSSLAKSRVRRVTMVGRRSADVVAFTIKEAREMINLPGCKPVFHTTDFEHLQQIIPDAPRSRKRLLELLYKTAVEPSEEQSLRWSAAKREWALRFLLKPRKIVNRETNGKVDGICFDVNRLEDGVPVATEASEFIPGGLILKSIGYTSVQIDPSIPFDANRGLVPNHEGKVDGHDGLYVSGWLGTGPVGVILATMQSGFSTGRLVVSHISDGSIDVSEEKDGNEALLKILGEKGVKPMTFNDWQSLDQFEVAEGKKMGKPREKITDLSRMVEIAEGKQTTNR